MMPHNEDEAAYDWIVDNDYIQSLYEDLFDVDYIASYEDNLVYLVPIELDSHIILGPFIKPEDVEPYVDALDIQIQHYPQDLCFDLKHNENEDVIEIHLGSNLQLGSDNLGGHNVIGLPYQLSSECMENLWTIEGKTLEQVKSDMIACGFTYYNFLDDK